ncbi:hypothetical protein [Saccharopolyspora rhizosphaerae]|uniref:hypothetical protein n=1 Tax=Saccharopolyspora rhizosphaerae TaxID=2492662 RepID=UPI000F6317CA|nr:hypothetical protein [Saccharopolyspora rhizosphaerae]
MRATTWVLACAAVLLSAILLVGPSITVRTEVLHHLRGRRVTYEHAGPSGPTTSASSKSAP